MAVAAFQVLHCVSALRNGNVNLLLLLLTRAAGCVLFSAHTHQLLLGVRLSSSFHREEIAFNISCAQRLNTEIV